ncbi:GDSL-type esterase/lipase family protein [uncultured Draconibacterium sp.]|uniref:GDSL-type esterase/lipase family protein n=1 Tax=uncultured Draconibacterium sp. TaxID=1573823 RepID=UPI003216710C
MNDTIWNIKNERTKQAYSLKLEACSLKKWSLVFGLLLFVVLISSAQENAYLYHVNQYNFIRTDLNEMHYPGTRKYADIFNQKLEKLVISGEGRINIVHIGGSHIQAGVYSGQMRTRLQQLNGEMNAGWGYMFPYRISRTNSPFGYYIRYNGRWQSFRNVERRKSGTLGVGGMSVTTSAPKAELTILLEKENQLDYSFNKFRVYYQNSEKNYKVLVDSALLVKAEQTDEYIDFEINQYVDSLKITVEKNYNSTGAFSLLGITTESAPNGIMYHSIGVNGAHVPAFLRCQLFEEQLAELKPDLVILGLGINDAYGNKFSQSKFESNYAELIAKIRKAAPNTAIIFTSNNDSYLYRRYVNKNGEKVQDSMFKLAKRFDAGVWDLYTVMGGLNSIVLWQKNNLAQSDRVHFTREGYLLVADLFFNALVQDFEKYILTTNTLTSSHFEIEERQ